MVKAKCLILKYYYFLGKKWSYPLIFHMDKNREYGFDDFIFISNRQISRSVLLDFLRSAIKLSIIEKRNKKYKLTILGIKLKKEFLKIRSILKEHNPSLTEGCNFNSLINKERKYMLQK